MKIVARLENGEVEAIIQGGPLVQAGEFPETCGGQYYYYGKQQGSVPAYADVVCRWEDVDFVRGGVYRNPPPVEYPCTLNIGPLVSPTPKASP